MNQHQLQQWLFNNLWYGENGTPSKDRHAIYQPLIMPATGKVWGIDISHWNIPPVDLKRMKDLYGLRFVFIKGCDGTLKSRYFDEHVAAAKYAGLPWGIYNWLYPSSKVNIDAQTTAWATQYNADPAPLGLVIDAEWTYYAGVQVNPNAADLLTAHNLIFDKIHNQDAITYTAKGYADQYLRGFDWTQETLWIAHYGVSAPALPTGATVYKFWQFASTLNGSVLDPHGNAELDGNYYNGTPEQFAVEYGSTPEPQGEYRTFRRFESDCHLVVTDPKKYRVLVTDTRGQLVKTSLIAEQFNAKFAINGDLFTLNKPDSLAASDGNLYQPVQMESNPFFNVTRTGLLQVGHKATPDLFNTVSGSHYLVQAGTVNIALFGTSATQTEKHPRTAVGYDAAGNIMLLVVEGRDATDAGTTLAQTAQILVEFGCQWGINLDGGGSSTLCVDGQIKNYLSDGTERPVINHLLLIPIGETMQAVEIQNTAPSTNYRTIREGPGVVFKEVGKFWGGSKVTGDFRFTYPSDNAANMAFAGDEWIQIGVNRWIALIHRGVIVSNLFLTPLPPPPSVDLSQLSITVSLDMDVEGNKYGKVILLDKK